MPARWLVAPDSFKGTHTAVQVARAIAEGPSLAAPEQITAAIASSPFAALTLTGLLELTSALPVAEELIAESLAYSMLLSGPEFLSWRASAPRRPVPWADEPVLLERRGDELEVTLNRPRRHNAFGRQVRDGLLEALTVAELDTTVASVRLVGAGASFCSGGDLDEFGTAVGVVPAHVVRLAHSAGHAVHRLRDRVRPELHGAGIEVPAFATHVRARPGSFFALPEVSMGLVPGAGGTVSVTRRIGRWRTAWMALTGSRIDLDTALAWGLVDGRA
jgi:hypothetical protein